MAMLVIIDESGDTGFKAGSSRHFIISMVVFEPVEVGGACPNAEHTAAVVKQAKLDLGHKPEFHFSQCKPKVRMGLLKALNEHNCQFSIYALVVNKDLVTSNELKQRPQKFYNYLLKLLLSRNPIHNAAVKLDGSKSKPYKKALNTYLRHGQDGMIRKFSFADSNKDILVQLADMVCGAIAHEYNNSGKLGSDEYRKLLKDRLKDVWEFE